MATLAALWKHAEAAAAAPGPALRVEPDPYRLRALPNEDVFFYCKKIDNSGVVREADPQSRGECWTAIGMATAMVVMLAGIMMPNVAATMAGYRYQELKQEEQRLLEERRVLDLEEARLLSPDRLEELARDRQLTAPAPSQVIHLDPNADGSLALNVKK
ncbi:MAG: hypothetical protein ACE15B_12865 [Bryobacteraceae bacterium]